MFLLLVLEHLHRAARLETDRLAGKLSALEASKYFARTKNFLSKLLRSPKKTTPRSSSFSPLVKLYILLW
ncbi:hypothetical protein L1987_81852 [Smallanthus sonchifolius]|uniref:Uncharacterized protein n=1 Tax=Smallanthus sonchifolius TaxID=185202 RepID=A0ACB8YS16_9ASTR|nr:hypothetical protein L1987_81852 [Smallanthus sonchifolius]